jgi:hypothetical protein
MSVIKNICGAGFQIHDSVIAYMVAVYSVQERYLMQR